MHEDHAAFDRATCSRVGPKGELSAIASRKVLRSGRSEKSTFLKGSLMLDIGGGALPGPPSAIASPKAATRTATTIRMVTRRRFMRWA